MPKLESDALDCHQRTFLAGSLIFEAVQALSRWRRPPLSLRNHWRILRAIRNPDELNRARLAAIGGHVGWDGLFLQLGRFDSARSDQSRRYAIGLAFVSTQTTIGGLIAAKLCLLRLRFSRKHMRLAAAAHPSGHSSGKLQYRLESWDDLTETNTAPDLATDHHGARDKRAAIDWLCSLGFDNSGVRIESVAERLIGRLSRGTLRAILALRDQANRDRAALAMLETDLMDKASRSEWIYLQRLISVLRCVDEGYSLPQMRGPKQYDPLPGSLFYLLHMRDPFELNGYVSRTHLMLASMRAAGLRPVAITRLGFPHDLARHKDATIAAEEMCQGLPVLALPDNRNGQIGRTVEGYIDAYAERIVELARKYRPAAIQAASNHLNGLAAIKAARLLGIPVVYEVRGIWEITQASANEAYASQLRYKMQRRLENLAVKEADRVITISEPLKRFVIGHGAAQEDVSIVPNGVDATNIRPLRRDPDIMARLKISLDDVVIGYIGSIVHYEGLDYLIEATGRLAKLGIKNLRLLLVGDGKELANLRALAAKNGLDDICIFLGRVPHEEVECLFSIVDIVALPRRSLPVTELVPPLKPYEAMAAGKAVIVSSVAALAGTVIHDKTGLVVEKDNVDELTMALRRLAQDRGLRARLGRSAREWVKTERSVPALAKRLGDVYRSLELSNEPTAGLNK